MESMKPRVCLIVAFYNGTSRNIEHGEGEGSFSTYLEKHKTCLKKYKHSLDTIIFAIAEDGRRKIEIVKHGGITYLFRPNKGMSFGSWVDTVNIYRGEFDYYIFGEDDYLFVKDNFDEILVNTYSKWGKDFIVNWSDGKPRGLTSTIGIVSKAALEKHRFLEDFWVQMVHAVNIGKADRSSGCMGAFGRVLRRPWPCLGHEHNCFPYWTGHSTRVIDKRANAMFPSDIYTYGYDSGVSRADNARRILLACSQSVGADGCVLADLIREPPPLPLPKEKEEAKMKRERERKRRIDEAAAQRRAKEMAKAKAFEQKREELQQQVRQEYQELKRKEMTDARRRKKEAARKDAEIRVATGVQAPRRRRTLRRKKRRSSQWGPGWRSL